MKLEQWKAGESALANNRGQLQNRLTLTSLERPWVTIQVWIGTAQDSPAILPLLRNMKDKTVELIHPLPQMEADVALNSVNNILIVPDNMVRR